MNLWAFLQKKQMHPPCFFHLDSVQYKCTLLIMAMWCECLCDLLFCARVFTRKIRACHQFSRRYLYQKAIPTILFNVFQTEFKSCEQMLCLTFKSHQDVVFSWCSIKADKHFKLLIKSNFNCAHILLNIFIRHESQG